MATQRKGADAVSTLHAGGDMRQSSAIVGAEKMSLAPCVAQDSRDVSEVNAASLLVLVEHEAERTVPESHTTLADAALIENGITQTNDDAALVERITQLWGDHDKAARLVETATTKHADLKQRRSEAKEKFKILQAELAECLFTYKQRLARKGRSGGWSNFLTQHGYARTTADRLVKRHEAVLKPKAENAPSGAFPAPTLEDVTIFVKKLAPKLVKILVTPELTAHFHRELATVSAPLG